MARAGRTLRLLAALLAAPLLGLAAAPLAAAEITVNSTRIERFAGALPGESVGALIWRGGLSMTSTDDTFGGLSGLGVLGDTQNLVFASDRGNFITGRLVYDAQLRPLGLVGARTEPMRDTAGAPLTRQIARDAEALAVVYRDGVPAAVRVGFENLTRVADYALTEGVPGGPARLVSLPDWLSALRTNESIESICIAPDASPVAGSTLILTEGARDAEGNRRGWLLGNRDRGPVSYVPSPGLDPTDCAFLPNGDLLVLERGVALISFVMALKRVPAADVAPGAVLAGETLLEAQGRDIDNMEALAVHTAPDGEVRILIGSDNNFNDWWQRTILLDFALPGVSMPEDAGPDEDAPPAG